MESNFILDNNIRNFNSSVGLKRLSFNVTASNLSTESQTSSIQLKGATALPSKSYNLDELIDFKSHVFAATLTTGTSLVEQDMALIKLLPRIQFERSLIFSRRTLQSLTTPKRPSNQRLLQLSSSQPTATLAVTKSNITLILFDSNNQIPHRSLIYIFNQTVLFETTVDKLEVVCHSLDFVLQPPLTLHIFLVCEDRLVRYVRAAVDKLDTGSSFVAVNRQGGYSTDRISVEWNGEAGFDTFYLGLIEYSDGRNPTLKLIAAKIVNGLP